MTKEEIRKLITLFTPEKIKLANDIMKGRPIFTLSLMKQIKRDEIIESFRSEEFESIAKSAKRYKIPKRTMYRITQLARKK